MVLGVVLVAELLAIVLVLSRFDGSRFWFDLARISVFVEWLALSSAALVCWGRPQLVRLRPVLATALIFIVLAVNTAAFSLFATWLGGVRVSPWFGPSVAPAQFLLRNEAICLIVAALLLRYFFMGHQWRAHIQAEARLRIDALQARIRPHFLFNSMNTIAALTRTDPPRAEEAVEDLADLFRATLSDPQRPLTIKEEMEVARIHQRIEALRLGDRLRVVWDVAALPMAATMPSLTLQPLLENAIYHGIERLDCGGTVTVAGEVCGDQVVLSVSNPVPPAMPHASHSGAGLALDNIRERLWLAYGEAGSLEVVADPRLYTVTMRFPLQT